MIETDAVGPGHFAVTIGTAGAQLSHMRIITLMA